MRYAQLIVLCLALTTAARGAEWQPAVRLNPDTEGWFPDVAADLAGRPHVVWSSGPMGGPEDMVHYCSPSPSGCRRVDALTRRPTRDGVYATRPSVAVDQHGVFHLLWRQKMLIVYTSTPLSTLFSPDDWHRPRKLGTGSYNTLAIDPEGTLHAAWGEPIFEHWGGPCDGDVPCYGCADIHYSRSTDGGLTWTLPVKLARTLGGSEKPQIAVGPEGMIYIAWEEGRDHYAGRGQPESSMLIASSDRGRTWSEPVKFTLPHDAPQSIALGVDLHGQVVVVWRETAGASVYYQTSGDRGRTWSIPQAIPDLSRRRYTNTLDDYDMAADSQGHLHLVLTGRLANAEHDRVLHVEWNGQQWSAPQSLFGAASTPEWPRIAVGNGNELHAVWFERPVGFESNAKGSKYGIWYAHGRSDAPFVAPLVWPEPATPRLTWSQALRLAQAALALLTVATVIVAARRRGW